MPAALPSPLAAVCRWPAPALGAWLAAWGSYAALHALGTQPHIATAAATALGMALAWRQGTAWRRGLMAAGFPLSWLAQGTASGWPAWAWLLAVLPLLAAYPPRAWRDAPFFPTPPQVLQGLAEAVPLAAGARVLDAGCGLGHGLQGLRAAWPLARLEGVEWSRPLAWLARRRCPWAQVRCGDMWAEPWHGLDLVYLFQRPETMPRALRKARAELAPGAWLLSLEFPLPDVVPTLRLGAGPHGWLWAYRMPPQDPGQENPGPPQVFLPPSGGGLGAARPAGRSTPGPDGRYPLQPLP